MLLSPLEISLQLAREEAHQWEFSHGELVSPAMKQPVTSFFSDGKSHEQENVPARDINFVHSQTAPIARPERPGIQHVRSS
jgi:hypothetical protein